MKTHPWLNEQLAINGKPIKENFSTWFGASKVVDSNGQPLVLFHGSKVKFESFEHGNASFYTLNNQYGPGFYLTNVEATARHHGQFVTAAYVRISNPISKMTASLTPELLDQIIQRSTYLFGRKWHAWFQGQDGNTDTVVRESFISGIEDQSDLKKMAALTKWFSSPSEMSRAIQEITGHDGVIATGVLAGVNVYTAFNAAQIKSATNNCGLFDRDSNNLYDTQIRLIPTECEGANVAVDRMRG